jgi:hypothetical protein
MADLTSYVEAPIMIILAVSFAIVSAGIISIIKKVSKTPNDQYKNKVVLITAVAFTISYTLKAIELSLAAWYHQSFTSTSNR